MTDTEHTRRLLLEHSETYRQLFADHHSLDDRLKALTAKPHLSDDEQIEETRLKKRKLRLKDEMEAIVRQYHASTTGPLPA